MAATRLFARALAVGAMFCALACSSRSSSHGDTTSGVFCDVPGAGSHVCYGYGDLAEAQEQAVAQACTGSLRGTISGSCPGGQVGCCKTTAAGVTTTECYYAGTSATLQSSCEAQLGTWSSGGTTSGGGGSAGDAGGSGGSPEASSGSDVGGGPPTMTGPCASDQVQCPKGCVDVETDVNNCGSCGYACPAGPAETTVACAAGQCVAACNAPLTNCSLGQTPSCVDVTSDPHNCGTCGNECPTAQNGGQAQCNQGSCSVTCPSGTSYCANAGCVDTSSSASSCGAGCVDCQALAMADGLSASNIQSLSCNQGACQAQVIGSAMVGTTAAGQSCEQLCQAALRVGCTTTNVPASCPTGGCAFYSGSVCGDDDEVGCSETIPASDGCGALSNVDCYCAGTANL